MTPEIALLFRFLGKLHEVTAYRTEWKIYAEDIDEKLCGCYPAGFPDVLVPGDHVWMRFQSDSSEQAWGVRFTLSGDGDGVSNSAVPFPCARSLLLATVSAVKERPEALSVRLLAASVLLAVAAAQPQSSEAALVCEALVTLLPEPAAWSTEAWGSLLELFSVSERFGQRAQLASLAQLISSQLGHQTLPLLDAVSADAAAAAPKRMALDKVRPIGAGILLNGQASNGVDLRSSRQPEQSRYTYRGNTRL
eukprot:s971_g3.t1